jgi:hypothetical protein
MQDAIATGDTQLGLNLARLLSDLAGAYVDQMAEGEAYLYVGPGHKGQCITCRPSHLLRCPDFPPLQTRMPLLMTVLQCTSHEDPDVALVTFSFWYRLSDRLYSVPGNAPHFVSCGPGGGELATRVGGHGYGRGVDEAAYRPHVLTAGSPPPGRLCRSVNHALPEPLSKVFLPGYAFLWPLRL